MSSVSAELPRPIVLADRYVLSRLIATGGMAEIFLSRQKGLPGLEREIVIKLLKERYRTDVRVVEMFLNEARIGTVLNHPHLVHVYDIGEHDATPFISMEYIQGEELSQLCRRGVEMGYFLPVEHAVDLVRQAAEGMGHFHGKRDDQGRELGIVHRDISPSNMMVTRDGDMKLIDFGIAKATWHDRRDKVDLEKLVPGKYNYMSPEQVRGERVDHRSDIFSLGIVLYELTVGKRLFKGRPEEVIQRIVRGKIKPPTFVRNKFPARLEQIVMKALEKNRADRYDSAYALAADLEEFLREPGRKSGSRRIAHYLEDLRALEAGEKRPELIIAGEAWLDDDGEDVLDFDRSFSTVRRETPAVTAVPAPVAGDNLSGPVPLAVVPAPVSTLTPRRPVPGDDEDPTSVADPAAVAADMAKTTDLSRSLDPELGDDGPTDAVPLVPAADLGISQEDVTGKSQMVPATPVAPAKPSEDVALEKLVEKDVGKRPAAHELPPLDALTEMAQDMSKTLEARPRPARLEVPLGASTPMPRRRRARSAPATIDLMLPREKEAEARDDQSPYKFGLALVETRKRPSLKVPVTAIAVVLAFVLLIFLLTRTPEPSTYVAVAQTANVPA